jgi:hypothetical protein
VLRGESLGPHDRRLADRAENAVVDHDVFLRSARAPGQAAAEVL